LDSFNVLELSSCAAEMDFQISKTLELVVNSMVKLSDLEDKIKPLVTKNSWITK